MEPGSEEPVTLFCFRFYSCGLIASMEPGSESPVTAYRSVKRGNPRQRFNGAGLRRAR